MFIFGLWFEYSLVKFFPTLLGLQTIQRYLCFHVVWEFVEDWSQQVDVLVGVLNFGINQYCEYQLGTIWKYLKFFLFVVQENRGEGVETSENLILEGKLEGKGGVRGPETKNLRKTTKT